MIFSIVVPFLNEEKYIEKCILALLYQDFDKSEYELIFINNGSSDKSLDIVRKYPQITLLNESIPNVYAARNKGIRASRGEIIAFIDADCEAAPRWLSEIYNAMRQKDAMIVLGGIRFPSSSSAFLKIFDEYERSKLDYVMSRSLQKYWFAFGGNMAVKRMAFNTVGCFSTHHINSGDIELIHRCVARGLGSNTVYLPTPQNTHLEVISLSSWLRKLFFYGYYINRMKDSLDHYQELTLIHKMRIFCSSATINHYSSLKIIMAIIILIFGNLVYSAGKSSGIFSRMTRKPALSISRKANEF